MRSFTEVSISTARLRLRPLVLADADQLFRIFSDPEFMRFWSSTPWESIERARSLIENDQKELAAGEHLRLGILLKEADTLIGTCSLFHFNAQSRRAEIGYGIAPTHWRMGFMHEAVSALIRYAFEELGMNRLEADIDPRNLASARSLEKLGFTREGLLRERWIVGGEVSDSALYGLLARDCPVPRNEEFCK
jgi:ribosomal-protein-alanine N-acetyltransferase